MWCDHLGRAIGNNIDPNDNNNRQGRIKEFGGPG